MPIFVFIFGGDDEPVQREMIGGFSRNPNGGGGFE